MRIVYIVILTLFLGILVGCDDAADGPVHGLSLELRTSSRVIKKDDIPDCTVDLINNGDQPVTVVLPGDGSDLGWRTPIVRWTPPDRRRTCVNINPVKSDEVVTLEPKERVELEWVGRPTLRGTGIHEVSVELEHVPTLTFQGIPLGKHDARTMRRIRKSRPFRVVSNTIRIEVQD